jgi:hypothetical protein
VSDLSAQFGRSGAAQVRDLGTLLPPRSFQIPVYVLPAAKVAAQQRRARERVTNAEVAFSAIDATFAELQQLLQSRRTIQRKDGSLFPSRRHRPRGSSAEPQSRRVAWVLQATAEELGVLDSLVVELGAESRSELIAAAIEAHLLTKSRR